MNERKRKEKTPRPDDIVIIISKEGIPMLKDWARSNFTVNDDEIQDHWHPIVIEECELMISESNDFLFENYIDTNLSGPAIQTLIDQTIEEAHGIILKEIPRNIQKSTDAVHEIAKLWFNCIESWKQRSLKNL